jgi:hypothetical protein
MEITLETYFGIVMVAFGIWALVFVSKAHKKFPEGSELEIITKKLVPVLTFLMCFSVWHVTREVFSLKKIYGEIIEYPEYLFISLTYILLFRIARRLYVMAKELGLTK